MKHTKKKTVTPTWEAILWAVQTDLATKVTEFAGSSGCGRFLVTIGVPLMHNGETVMPGLYLLDVHSPMVLKVPKKWTPVHDVEEVEPRRVITSLMWRLGVAG